MWWFRTALFLSFLTLSGCGFQPLYGRHDAASRPVAVELSAVYVVPLKDRVGRLVRNFLLDDLHSGRSSEGSRYLLRIALTPSQEGVALARDEAVTRYNYRLLVTFSLIDRAAERVIYEGRARSVAAYNVVAADYATLTAERDAQARAARLVSREIETSLAVFFNRRRRG